MNNMEDIKKVEQELMRVRLGIMEDEKEFKELDKKIKNLYIGFPLGLAYGIWGLFFAISLQKGGGENLWSIFGIIFVASIFWSVFILFGTSVGQRAKKLYYGSIPAKKKKKKQLENKIKQLLYLEKVKAKKEEL